MFNVVLRFCLPKSYCPFSLQNPEDFTERLIKANELWYELISMEMASTQKSDPLNNRNMLFSLFSRFVHELVLDHNLRGKLLAHMERQIKEDKIVLATKEPVVQNNLAD